APGAPRARVVQDRRPPVEGDLPHTAPPGGGPRGGPTLLAIEDRDRGEGRRDGSSRRRDPSAARPNGAPRAQAGSAAEGGGGGPTVRRPPVRRLITLFLFLTFGLGGILVRLAVLQVRDASAYEKAALNQRLRVIDVPPQRGAILDRDRQPLAMSLAA